jgi:release factor glutamine methyltransferase
MTAPAEAWTIRRLLEWTTPFFTRKGLDSPRLSAELLLSHVLELPRIKLYTDYERPLSQEELSGYRALVQRASEHEPIAYLTGTAHFFNLEMEVDRSVLIPRPETETLVENVLQLARNEGGMEAPRVLDLCTGSGCIAAAIAFHLKTATVLAGDISAAAIHMAQKNIDRLGLADRVTLQQGDLYEAVAKAVDPRPFDLLVANPPYIPTGQIASLDRNVRDYEPLAALDGGRDGMMFHRRILAGASEHLRAGGRVFLEIAFDQAELAMKVAAEQPALQDARILKDYGGRPRVLMARMKS